MRVFTSLFLGAFLLISFAGEKKVNFSGQWTLNEKKSDLGEEGGRRMVATKLTVTQTQDTLVIERLMVRRSGEESKITEKLTLDGKECENILFERPRKSTATWSRDGTSLTIFSKSVFEREGNKIEITTVEIWKLTEDGNSLSIGHTSKSPRGERKANYIYDKEKVTK